MQAIVYFIVIQTNIITAGAYVNYFLVITIIIQLSKCENNKGWLSKYVYGVKFKVFKSFAPAATHLGGMAKGKKGEGVRGIGNQ